MKKCAAFVLSCLLLWEPAVQAVLSVRGTDVLDTENIQISQQSSVVTSVTTAAEVNSGAEASLAADDRDDTAWVTMENTASYAAATIDADAITAKQAAFFAYEAPVYKDHIFYGSRTGNVLMFEEYTTSNEKRYAIQSSVNGVAVRGIEEEALYGITGDVTLVIPDSVSSIAAWEDLTASAYEGGYTGKATIVCEEGSKAKEYAKKNNISVRTPQEDQKRIDALTFRDKTITVYYNKRSLTTADDTNNYVAAENGKDVTVTLLESGTTEGRTITLNKAGSASIHASEAAVLEIQKEGYYTQTLDFKSLDAKETKIYLEPVGEIVVKSLKVAYTDENGVTAYTDVYHDQYVIDRYSDATTDLLAEVDWGDHGKGTLSLYQTGSEVAFTDNALCFVLKEKFDTAEDIYLVAKAEDGTKLERKLNIVAADVLLEGTELDLTGGLKLTLPDKIPFIGGSDMDVDLGKFPVKICIENGKIYVVFGIYEYDYSYKDENLGDDKPGEKEKTKRLYLDIKKTFKDAKGDYKKSIDKIRNGYKDVKMHEVRKDKSIIGNVQLVGYLEGYLSPSGGIKWGDGQIIITAEGKIEWGGQYTLGPVPMYWKVYLKGDAEGKLSVSGVIGAITGSKRAPFQPLGSVGFGVAVGGSTGVGGKDILSFGGGVEGSANLDFTFKRDVGNAKLGGAFSVFIEAKAFFFSWNKKWTVTQGTWATGNFYNNNKTRSIAQQLQAPGEAASANAADMSGLYTPSHYQLEDRSYLSAGGAFTANDELLLYPVEAVVSAADGEEPAMSSPVWNSTLQSFQENTYQNAEAQMVQLDNGTQLMVWIGGAADRVSPNLTAVYYSYRTSGGAWTTPALLADDGTADFLPILAASGNVAWVVWQNTNTVFTEAELEDAEAAMPKTAAAMEICAAQFNGTGFDAAVSLTENDIYDNSPVVAVQGNEAVVYWLQSASNDLLGTDSETCVMRSVYDGSIWSAAEAVYQATAPIKSLVAGWGTDGARYALTLDADGDMETTADMELFADGAQLTDNAVIDSAPVFSAGELYWYQNGAIVNEKGETLLPADTALPTDQFRIYSDAATGDRAIVYQNCSGTYAETYAIFQNDGLTSKAAAVTGTGQHTTPGVGYYTAHTLYLPCMVTEVLETETGTEEGVENISSPYGQTDLYTLSHAQSAVLSIEDVSFDSARLVAGNAFTVYVMVRNDGTLPAENFDVVLWDTLEKMPANGSERNPKVADYRAVEALAGGASESVALTFVLPEDFAGTYELTLTESSTGAYNDAAIYQNAMDKENVTFFDRDLIMTAEMVQNSNGQFVAKGVIGNVGKEAQEDLLVSLYRVEDAETAVLLDTQTISVEANSQAIAAFVIEEPVSSLYRIQVAEQENETNIANNADICGLWMDTHTGTRTGDLNGDGMVDTADTALLYDWFAGKYTEIPFDTTVADCNGDGVFTRADGMYLARAIAGWDEYTVD